MFVYKITNTINGKVYIGQTIRPIKQRFHRHINDALNNVIDTHFSRAIRKYGENNFEIETIDVAESQKDLNLKEQFWIRHYNSVDPKCGYNETDALYKCGGNTYQSKTEKEIELISKKISESKTGNKNPNSKSVKCFNVNTGEELFFETVKECKEHFNEKNHRFITTRTNGQISGLYKNEWKIAYADCEYGDFYPMRYRTGLGLEVFDLNTNQVKTFGSIRLASRELNISRNEINKHLKNGEKEFAVEQYKITILN